MIQCSTKKLLEIWNVCNVKALSLTQRKRCNEQQLLLQDMWTTVIEDFPDITFASVQSKVDATQIKFEKYFMITELFNLVGFMMNPGQFYQASSELIADWQRRPNYKSYLVDGQLHVLLFRDWVYTTTPK